MDVAVFLVCLAVGVLSVTAVADRIGAPAPLLLVMVGALVSYAPGMPEIRLPPEIVLLGLLPPLLYATAVKSSLVDFNANRRSILLLSVGLVAFTTAGVAMVIHLVLPGVSWPVAFAIGAVVAPPDAVAATAIGRRIGLPRRMVTILEGESLLNDATALVALSTALYAIGHSVQGWRIGVDFLIAAGGGVAVGLLVYAVVARIRRHVTDPLLDTAIAFVIPFAAYILAEELTASGVLAVVVAGLLLGHRAPILQSARSRIAERTNWDTAGYILENAVFLLIGLQASWLIRDVSTSELSGGEIVLVCAATLAAVVALRMVWLLGARFLLRRSPAGRRPPWRHMVVVGWAGMRGVVTLAAAFTIPDDVPDREILLLIAFTVVAGTLFVQGLTLPLLARALKLPAPDPLDHALARATVLQQASKAGRDALDEIEIDDPHGVVDVVEQRVERRNHAAWENLNTTADQETPSELYARVRAAMIDAERRRVLEIRSTGAVPSEVIAEVLTMLDVEESMIDRAVDARTRLRVAANPLAPAPTGAVPPCSHLRELSAVATVTDGTCPECVESGQKWVALRQCLVCGHIGCCDSSTGRHATAHFHDTVHPVIQSAEPDERWRWCFVHHIIA